jgi:hypothetical protein
VPTHEYPNRTLKRSWEDLVLIFSGPEDSEEKKRIRTFGEQYEQWQQQRQRALDAFHVN